MAFSVTRLSSRTDGVYAVRLGSGDHVTYVVFREGEATLERLQSIFSGASVYKKINGIWKRT